MKRQGWGEGLTECVYKVQDGDFCWLRVWGRESSVMSWKVGETELVLLGHVWDGATGWDSVLRLCYEMAKNNLPGKRLVTRLEVGIWSGQRSLL